MLDPDRPFLISPPFGAYFSHPRAYSVLGSYTAERRDKGSTGESRTARVFKTVRPVPGGWVNSIGLRNPGWDTLPIWKRTDSNGPFPEHQIISMAPLDSGDWQRIERWLDDRFQQATIEINISCPNVNEHPELPHSRLLRRITGAGATVIFKLPPLASSVFTAQKLAGCGALYLHLSNTLPSPVGGVSGAALREVNLPLVHEVATRLLLRVPKVEIIAGGGIYSGEHVDQYRGAGATRFSLATAWFWPPRAWRIMRRSR